MQDLSLSKVHEILRIFRGQKLWTVGNPKGSWEWTWQGAKETQKARASTATTIVIFVSSSPPVMKWCIPSEGFVNFYTSKILLGLICQKRHTKVQINAIFTYLYINPTGEKDNQNLWVGHRRSLSWRTWKTRLKLHRSRLTARCGRSMLVYIERPALWGP